MKERKKELRERGREKDERKRKKKMGEKSFGSQNFSSFKSEQNVLFLSFPHSSSSLFLFLSPFTYPDSSDQRKNVKKEKECVCERKKKGYHFVCLLISYSR